MSKQRQETPAAAVEQQEHTKRNAVIGNFVLTTLGQPGDFQRVQVKQLWDDRFRVNVFVGVDSISAKVAHSFFLTADGAGTILTSTPAIKRHYESARSTSDSSLLRK